MKYLFVGDVHNHSYIFDDVDRLDKEYNFDRIIFLGDYVDDWLTDNHDSLKTLDKIFSLKEKDPNKYTFLIGNHELSYLGYKCSGHMTELEDIMEMKLKENLDKLDLYTSIQCGDREYICTHAGITNKFINNILKGKDNWKTELENMNQTKLKSLCLLNMVSYIRGGLSSFSSFLWADLREHLLYNQEVEPIIPNQIIGHTPVKTIIDENNFIFIDTHSTYRNGKPFGDKSYLMWDEEILGLLKVNKVKE